MTLAIKKRRDQTGSPTHGAAFLLGSIMPDIPLTLFTVAYFVYWRWFTDRSEFIFGPTYDAIYFENPFMIAAHNLFHAPVPILCIGLTGYWLMQRTNQGSGTQSTWWGRAFFWFAVACAFHSIVDILTHHNDGPLLLFPFNWQVRFISPVSYWDPDHYGDIFSVFELTLDVAILAWLLWLWWSNRRIQRRAESGR